LRGGLRLRSRHHGVGKTRGESDRHGADAALHGIGDGGAQTARDAARTHQGGGVRLALRSAIAPSGAATRTAALLNCSADLESSFVHKSRGRMIFRFRTIAARTSFVIAAAAILTTGLGAQQPPAQDGLLARRAETRIAPSGTDLEQLQALLKQAWILNPTTEPDKATALFDQARAEAIRLNADRELGDALRGLANVHIKQFRDKDARPLLEQAVPL